MERPTHRLGRLPQRQLRQGTHPSSKCLWESSASWRALKARAAGRETAPRHGLQMTLAVLFHQEVLTFTDHARGSAILGRNVTRRPGSNERIARGIRGTGHGIQERIEAVLLLSQREAGNQVRSVSHTSWNAGSSHLRRLTFLARSSNVNAVGPQFFCLIARLKANFTRPDLVS